MESIEDKASIIEAFFSFAIKEQNQEIEQLIKSEKLNEVEARHYISTSLKRGYASENGTELNDILPKISPLNPNYLTKKQSVFEKVVNLVEKFKNIGGDY